MHAKGYPSIGDAKDTVPIPNDGSVRFCPETFKFIGDKSEWLGYGLERKGRFVGLPETKDGKKKTECGIHLEGESEDFERDLWDQEQNIIELITQEDSLDFVNNTDLGLMVIYAPWCKYCQAMEAQYAKLSNSKTLKSQGVKVAKFRVDLDRRFVKDNFDATTFPTIVAVKNGKQVKYNSEDRSVGALKKFLTDL